MSGSIHATVRRGHRLTQSWPAHIPRTKYEGHHMNRIVRVAVLATLATLGIATATGTASADRTGIINGYSACQDAATSYRNAGYTADCILLQGDKYVVDYRRSGTGNSSPLSLQGFAQQLAGILASGSASASQ